MQIFKFFLAGLMLLFSLPAVARNGKVDIQVNFRGDENLVRKGLDLRNKDASQRDVYLFENQKLDLYRNRIQIRLRIEDGTYELGVKRWDVTPEEYEHYEHVLNSRCEEDIHGDVVVPACVAKIFLEKDVAKKLLAGEITILEALSREQLGLLIHGKLPSHETLRSLRKLGPVKSRAWTWKDHGWKYSLDIQSLPNREEPFMELSVKAEGVKPARLRAIVEGELLEAGLEIPRDQNGRRLEKLRALLECEARLNAKSK